MKYQTYAQVPWFRKSFVSSILLFIGLFFPPFIWVVALLLITGDVYEKALDINGSPKVWSKANKVAAWILLALQVSSIAYFILSRV